MGNGPWDNYQQQDAAPWQEFAINGRADASRILTAISTLEGLENPSQEEQATLQRLKAQQNPATHEMGRFPAAGRGAMQGLTFGFGDEIAAGVSGVLGDQPFQEGYDRELEGQRLDNLLAQQTHGSDYDAGKFTGMAASSVLPASWMGRATTGIGMGLRGLAAGGVEGGLQGFGEGEGGFGPRIDNAIPGAAVGAGVGLMTPLLASGAGRIARALQGGGDVLEGFSGAAARKASNAMRNNQRVNAPNDIEDYLARVGAEGTLADVPGALQSRAQGLAVMPGEGGELIAKTLRERAEGAGPRIVNDVDEVLGGPGEAYAARAAQNAQRQNVGSPLYESALAHPDPLNTDGLADSFQARMDVAGPKTGPVLRDFQAALGGDLSAEQLHNIRSDLSDAMAAASRAGNNKQATVLGDALTEVDTVLDGVPGYANARAVWAETYEVEDALDAGRNALAGGAVSAQSPQAMQDMLAGMKENEREAFVQGVREYIAAQMGTARNAPSAARGALGKEWNREKIEAILGADEATQLFNRLEAEGDFSRTLQRIDNGSMTQQRAEAAAEMGDLRQPETLRRPGPIRRAKMGADELGNAIVDALSTNRRANANIDMGRILSAQGSERDAIVQQLLRNVQRGPQTKAEKLTIAALRPLLLGGISTQGNYNE